MAVATTGRDPKKTMIHMENMSFDSVHEILARIPLTINPVSGSTERQTAIQGNASLTLSYDVDGNLETLVKTVDGTDYTKTFTWVGGELTTISTWS